jgi:hypothetical protein
MRPDSDKYYCYQWCGLMQWVCVCDATGRYCNWVFGHSSGRIVPGRAGSWGGYQQFDDPNGGASGTVNKQVFID